MTAITRPFDEHRYATGLNLTRAPLDVLALARELANDDDYLPTRTAAHRLDIPTPFGRGLRSLNAAYKRIRRLRDAGLLHTQLMWATGNGGGYPIKVPRRDGGKGIELRSWLIAWPTSPERWGEPDEVESRFDPPAASISGHGIDKTEKVRNPTWHSNCR